MQVLLKTIPFRDGILELQCWESFWGVKSAIKDLKNSVFLSLQSQIEKTAPPLNQVNYGLNNS